MPKPEATPEDNAKNSLSQTVLPVEESIDLILPSELAK